MKNQSRGKPWLKLIQIICAVVIMLTGVGLQADEAANIEIKIQRVALFKNGLGYFTSSAALPKGATTAVIEQIPVPSNGTFWIGYPKDLKVRSLITSMVDVKENVAPRNVAELLRANHGRKVTVRTSLKDTPAITGTIVKVAPQDTLAPPSPYLMDIRRSFSRNRYPPYPTTQLVVLKTKTGSVVLNAGSIIRADFQNDDIITSVPVVSKKPSIRIELNEATKGQRIGISYLARGITWAPSYIIDISDPKTAKLSAKAVVINEAADLQKVHLDLVTGFPNIQFADVNSPVAMTQNLEGFLKALTTGQSERRAKAKRRFMASQLMISNEYEYQDYKGVPMPGYSTAKEGVVSEDLFLYPVGDFTLGRNETACIPLFTAKVPYKHIYIWKISDMLDQDERYQYDRRSKDRPRGQEVWHCARLDNNMKMPWTTAPAEFVKDGQFTGQDICYYTAPGTKTTIRINRAMNVVAETAELEMHRKRNAAEFYGRWYDLVKVKGELKLQNRLNKTATVEVTKDLSGEVLETAPQARDIPTAKGLKRVNPRHVLVWEIELKAGQSQTLSYTYEVYVRN